MFVIHIVRSLEAQRLVAGLAPQLSDVPKDITSRLSTLVISIVRTLLVIITTHGPKMAILLQDVYRKCWAREEQGFSPAMLLLSGEGDSSPEASSRLSLRSC